MEHLGQNFQHPHPRTIGPELVAGRTLRSPVQKLAPGLNTAFLSCCKWPLPGHTQAGTLTGLSSVTHEAVRFSSSEARPGPPPRAGHRSSVEGWESVPVTARLLGVHGSSGEMRHREDWDRRTGGAGTPLPLLRLRMSLGLAGVLEAFRGHPEKQEAQPALGQCPHR